MKGHITFNYKLCLQREVLEVLHSMLSHLSKHIHRKVYQRKVKNYPLFRSSILQGLNLHKKCLKINFIHQKEYYRTHTEDQQLMFTSESAYRANAI